MTIDNPFDFPRALAESAGETVIVIHGDCRLILAGGRVLSCSGSPEVDVEPVTVDFPDRDVTGRTGAPWPDEWEMQNDLPTADDLAVIGVRRPKSPFDAMIDRACGNTEEDYE